MWLAVPGILKSDLFDFRINKVLAQWSVGKEKPEGVERDTAMDHDRRNSPMMINSF